MIRFKVLLEIHSLARNPTLAERLVADLYAGDYLQCKVDAFIAQQFLIDHAFAEATVEAITNIGRME